MDDATPAANIIIGYTAGVFDLFHVGHLRILHNAAALCDRLIVGVSSDELVQYKGKSPIIPFVERMEIVQHLRGRARGRASVRHGQVRHVGEAASFDVMFVGDDWHGTEKWRAIDKQFADVGVKIIYFPYTQGTSSTMVAKELHAREHVV